MPVWCDSRAKDLPLLMKTSLDHLPINKQHELRRAVEIIFDEFDDALKGGEADFKKRGRILKIILFGSYARGTFVDEPHTKKGYRSDFDILVIVNNKKLSDSAFWNRANDRLMRDQEIETPVSVIVHALREVNTDLRRGRYFFVDIARDGIALYELDSERLATPGEISPEIAWRMASEYLADRLPHAKTFAEGAAFFISKSRYKEAAFLLHQSIEQAYATALLVLTNYSPASHNLRFLRGLAEERARRGFFQCFLGPLIETLSRKFGSQSSSAVHFRSNTKHHLAKIGLLRLFADALAGLKVIIDSFVECLLQFTNTVPVKPDYVRNACNLAEEQFVLRVEFYASVITVVSHGVHSSTPICVRNSRASRT